MKLLFTPILMLWCSIGFTQAPKYDSFEHAETIIKNFIKKKHIPGMAISVSKNGALIWSKGFGYADLKSKTPVKPDETIFRIASISKSITAVTLGILVDDSIINLNKSIYHYLPDYPKKKIRFYHKATWWQSCWNQTL